MQERGEEDEQRDGEGQGGLQRKRSLQFL
jgi:hypothetical protein